MRKRALRREPDTGKISARAIISFIITFMLCSLIIVISTINRMEVERLTMEQLIMDKSAKANEVLSHLLFKTQTLTSLVLQNDGDIENFTQVATTVVDDPSILNVLIAPDGIVTDVFPLVGNEAVLGLNFFEEGAGNKEAIQAKETGQLVFGGPFTSVQGETVLVGRLPVYLPGSDGETRFWGLVSVTLKYPQALDGAGLNELNVQGFAYEIWRINPDNGQKQIITESDKKYNKNVRYVEKQIYIQNAEWYFRILPVRAWYEYPDTWLMIFLGLCISILVGFVLQNNSELKSLKTNYEILSHTDSLTGIYNRRYFMEIAEAQAERVTRTNTGAFIILFDIDYFKQINDSYGHLAGDDVLKGIAARVKDIIRPYDLLSRYGGEEFIMFTTDIDIKNVYNLAERIRLKIAETPFECGNIQVSVTASFGIAPLSPANSIMKTIDLADKALYTAKKDGRNKVVIYGYWATFIHGKD